jgi:hypothetical protein
MSLRINSEAPNFNATSMSGSAMIFSTQPEGVVFILGFLHIHELVELQPCRVNVSRNSQLDAH